MNILNLVLVLIVGGGLLGLVNRFIPMPGMIKTLINLVVIVALFIYVLEFFHLINTVLPLPQIV